MKNFGLRQRILKNELTIGSWVTIGHQSVIEIMASAGFDWLTIDLEHSVIDLSKAQELIAHIQSSGMSALVRVSKNEEVIIKRVMDAGANGVIVPLVNSKKDAEQAVSFVKYPPAGHRGVGLTRAQNYGIGFQEYKKWLEEDSVVIAQIEHIDAVNNLTAILDTPGIDGIIIGPYDLSASMGYPGEFERNDVQVAQDKIRKTCAEKKKTMGFHVIAPDHEKLTEKINEGYRFLAFSLDFLYLGEKARQEMSLVRKNQK
jgi:2-dehydro-3-deoxyglucarate aldolase